MYMGTMGLTGVAQATATLLLLSCSVAAATATSQKAYHQVPTFDLDDLYTGRRDQELAQVLSTTGLLSVAPPIPPALSPDHPASRDAALGGLCSCLAASQPVEDVPSVERVTLGDGAAVRTTVATASEGLRTPLPLPSQSLLGELGCSPDTVGAMEGLRGDAAVASRAFVAALDRLVGGDGVLLRTKGGEGEGEGVEGGREYRSVSSAVDDATNLEHFHVYSREGGDESHRDPHNREAETLELHADAGLFLTFVPARPCGEGGDGEKDKSFLVTVGEENSVRRAVFPQDGIAVMLGVGAEHWLEGNEKNVKLRATKHAVSMRDGQSRAWYGMMHLVPQDVIVERSTGSTLADVRSAMAAATAATDHVDIGCGSRSVEKPGGDAVSTHRLLQHVDPSECDNADNFFCWLSCLEIPDVPEGQEEAARSGDLSLYCAQTELYAADASLADAVQNCTGPDGVPGSIMNPPCEGMWAATDPAAPASKVDVDAVITDDQMEDGMGGDADDGGDGGGMDHSGHDMGGGGHPDNGNMTGHDGGMDMDKGNTTGHDGMDMDKGNMTGHDDIYMDKGNMTGHDDMNKGNMTGHDGMEGNMTGHDGMDMGSEGMGMGGGGTGAGCGEGEVEMEEQRSNNPANADSSADVSLRVVMSMVVLAWSVVSLAKL